MNGDAESTVHFLGLQFWAALHMFSKGSQLYPARVVYLTTLLDPSQMPLLLYYERDPANGATIFQNLADIRHACMLLSLK